MSLCVGEGCAKQAKSRGLCYEHYHRERRRGMPLLTPEDRFWSSVEKTESCWLWRGARTRAYGVVRRLGLRAGAHRVAWEIANGPIPAGMYVCHRCDTPLCVNHAHLFLGTNAENTADKVRKGRQSRGEAHGNSKLDEAAVREILTSSEPAAVLSPRFGVGANHISAVRRRCVWAHVEVNP